MRKATDLRIPGPTPLPPQVKAALQRDMIPHRSAEFRQVFSALREQVRRVHGTDGEVLIFPGSGSAGWEAAIVNTLSPGDRVIAFIAGDFGTRFARVAERFGLMVERVSVEPGQAVTADVVAPALAAWPDAKAVLYTHNETSTGVTNPLRQIGPMVREHGALLLVDGVSSVAGIPLEMDAWGVDLVLSGSQKAWMCPPGLVIIAAGERIWEATAHAAFPRFFWDFSAARAAASRGDTPTTAPLSLLFALKAACDMLDEEGLEQVYRRHHELAEHVRNGLEALGFRLLAERPYASDTVTAAIPPEGLAPAAIITQMRDAYGIEIAGGQAELAGQIIRVGHMGWVHRPELDEFLAAVAAVGDEIVTTGRRN